jgi:hypothetical protein
MKSEGHTTSCSFFFLSPDASEPKTSLKEMLISLALGVNSYLHLESRIE